MPSFAFLQVPEENRKVSLQLIMGYPFVIMGLKVRLFCYSQIENRIVTYGKFVVVLISEWFVVIFCRSVMILFICLSFNNHRTNVSFKLVSVPRLVNLVLLSSWSFYCVLEKLTSLFYQALVSPQTCQTLQYSHRQYSLTGLICQQQKCSSVTLKNVMCHKLSDFFIQTETETKCIHTQTKDKRPCHKRKKCSLHFVIS